MVAGDDTVTTSKSKDYHKEYRGGDGIDKLDGKSVGRALKLYGDGGEGADTLEGGGGSDTLHCR